MFIVLAVVLAAGAMSHFTHHPATPVATPPRNAALCPRAVAYKANGITYVATEVRPCHASK